VTSDAHHDNELTIEPQASQEDVSIVPLLRVTTASLGNSALNERLAFWRVVLTIRSFVE
jgi:hypothetical protein